MAVLEIDGRLLIVDCGVLFPEESQPGVDLILPDFDPSPTGWTTSRRSCSPTGTRTTSVGCHSCCGALGHPAARLPADPGNDRGQAARAPDHVLLVGGSRRPAERVGPFDLEFFAVNHSIPDALAVAHPHRRGHSPAHRRLQDGPAAARRADHRPARLRPARGGGHRPGHGRLHQCGGAWVRPPRGRHRPRAGQGVPPRRRADHRGQLRLPRAPHPAGPRRRRHARAQVRLRRSVDGAQHERGARPGLPDGAPGLLVGADDLRPARPTRWC